MRYLLCNEVVRDLEFGRQCELAAQLGYDGLELAPFTLGENPHRLSSAKRNELRRTADEAGIVIGSLHLLLRTPKGLSITSGDRDVRRRTLEVMEGLIELCVELGGSVLVHGSPTQRSLPAEDRQGATMRGKDAFAHAAQVAEAAGVTYCIEPLDLQQTEFVNTVAEAAAIVEELNNPALRTMVDFRAASFAEGEPVAQLLERWLPTGLVAHIHLNDSNKRAPGQGEDLFTPSLEALQRANFPGYCGVEPFVYVPDGPTTAARAIGYLRGIEEGLERSDRVI